MSTLRLHMPQWQGGNLAEYHLSSQVLSFLLPKSDGPDVTIPVPSPLETGSLDLVDGIRGKPIVLEQARAAFAALDLHQPDRVLTIGGDCMVDFAPIAWLNKRYRGTLGVLWIDAHPDVQTVAETPNAHAQVLGMLLHHGDPDFVANVPVPLDPAKVMYAGLDEWSPTEDKIIGGLKLRTATSHALAENSAAVLDWIAAEGIRHVAVHLDIDVIAPNRFRAILFNRPDAGPDLLQGVPRGRMEPAHVIRLLADVGKVCDIVGLAITEYMSWEALQTRALLEQLPLVKS